MKTRLLLAPLVLALVVSLAACGGSSSSSVPSNAIATVDGQPILLSDYNFWLQEDENQSKAQSGQAATPSELRPQVVALLVQFTEVEQQAKKLHVSVSQAEVTKFLTKAVKDNFGGSNKKLLAAMKQQGVSMQALRIKIMQGLLQQKIRTAVTKGAGAQVTLAQEHAYYTQNIQQYETKAQTSRSVEYILFQCAVRPSTTCPAAKSKQEKAKAEMVLQKLHNGADFGAMAKQYSDDSSTAPNDGKFTLVQGSVVPAFATAGFALKTGAYTQQPVDATSAANSGYGWFLVKALGPTKTTKAHTTPFSQVQKQIKQTLVGQQQDTIFQKWISDLVKSYQGKIKYQNGFAPPPTTSVTNLPTTTG